MAADPTPQQPATPASTAGIQPTPKAAISQEHPSNLNKPQASDAIPQLSPIEASLRTHPSSDKPSQGTFSKSRQAEDSHDRQAADEFLDGLFASVLEES